MVFIIDTSGTIHFVSPTVRRILDFTEVGGSRLEGLLVGMGWALGVQIGATVARASTSRVSFYAAVASRPLSLWLLLLRFASLRFASRPLAPRPLPHALMPP